MADPFYTTTAWKTVRAHVLERDAGRCTVGILLGGGCSPVAHVHHLIPRTERPDLALDETNCLTACSRHHPTLEAARRFLLRRRTLELPACRHVHRYAEGRRQCEERRRERILARL